MPTSFNLQLICQPRIVIDARSIIGSLDFLVPQTRNLLLYLDLTRCCCQHGKRGPADFDHAGFHDVGADLGCRVDGRNWEDVWLESCHSRPVPSSYPLRRGASYRRGKPEVFLDIDDTHFEVTMSHETCDTYDGSQLKSNHVFKRAHMEHVMRDNVNTCFLLLQGQCSTGCLLPWGTWLNVSGS